MSPRQVGHLSPALLVLQHLYPLYQTESLENHVARSIPSAQIDRRTIARITVALLCISTTEPIYLVLFFSCRWGAATESKSYLRHN